MQYDILSDDSFQSKFQKLMNVSNININAIFFNISFVKIKNLLNN